GHTRFSRDWSSDVCSSDLTRSPIMIWSMTDPFPAAGQGAGPPTGKTGRHASTMEHTQIGLYALPPAQFDSHSHPADAAAHAGHLPDRHNTARVISRRW